MEELREKMYALLKEKETSNVEVLELSRELDVWIKESYQLGFLY